MHKFIHRIWMFFRRSAAIVFCTVLAAMALTGALIAHEQDVQSVWISAETIKGWLLKQAPYGSSAEKVKLMISSNGWPLTFDRSLKEPDTPQREYPGVKGIRAVAADLGTHSHFPGSPSSADAFWGFDESGRLIDLKVRDFASNAL
jgi:hypothetical protein